jgi:hypothetical protein
MFGLSNPLQSIAALMPKQHIFLLSHMRAYTSLFGHIMGSNPEVCGYYEMHIGYYSWKSLERQKLLYFKNEEMKPNFSRMFDKVLHNDHQVSNEILSRRRTKTIFSLRRPQDTIPSILNLYKDIDPSHAFNSESFATEYYIQRLVELESLAASLKQAFFYFDAESLKQDPEDCLERLSNWLQLEVPLSPNYGLQRKTSRVRFGDTSSKLEAGRVIEGNSTYTCFRYSTETMNEAIRMHDKVRKLLVEKSAHRSIFAPEIL